jgi:hypothetical protein
MPPKATSAALGAGTIAAAATGPKAVWYSWPAWSGVLKSRVPVLVLGAWLLLYAGRPFSLGFFSDDWAFLVTNTQSSAPFSLARLSHFLGTDTVYAARPVAGLISFAISSIAGQNPFAYQVFCALLALVAALSLRSWLRTLLPEASQLHPFAADLAAVVWLSLPWSVVTTAWPICAIAVLPAQILFTEAARLMAGGQGRGWKRILLSAALLLASYLTYEAFYFQGVLLAAFYWLRAGRRSGPWRHRLVLAACVAQAAAIALNRFVAQLNPVRSKAFASAWQSYSWMSLRLLPDELLRSLGSLGAASTALFAIIVAAAISSAVIWLLNSEWRRLAGAFGVIAFSLGTIPVFCVIYALAGYRIAFTGMTSRTLTGVSWALAVLLYGLLSTILSARRRVVAVGGAAAALLFAVVCGMAQQLHVSQLVAVWREEKTILAHVPVERIRSLPNGPQINILYIGPSYHGDIPIFGAVWELTAAVFSLPEMHGWQNPDQSAVQIHPATTLYNWSFDGDALIQECPGYWKSRFKGKILYIWDYNEGRIFQVEKGFRWNPGERTGSWKSPLSSGGGTSARLPAIAIPLLLVQNHQHS